MCRNEKTKICSSIITYCVQVLVHLRKKDKICNKLLLAYILPISFVLLFPFLEQYSDELKMYKAHCSFKCWYGNWQELLEECLYYWERKTAKKNKTFITHTIHHFIKYMIDLSAYVFKDWTDLQKKVNNTVQYLLVDYCN